MVRHTPPLAWLCSLTGYIQDRYEVCINQAPHLGSEVHMTGGVSLRVLSSIYNLYKRCQAPVGIIWFSITLFILGGR